MNPSSGISRGPSRIVAIDGFRAYLALWVVGCHVLWYSGYEESAIGTPLKLISRGHYPVDVFIIISGFVIFFLLDRRNAIPADFIRQRFFRLFPLFFTLFLVGVLLYKVQVWNFEQIRYFSPDRSAHTAAQLASWIEHVYLSIALHVTMLHGIVPEIAYQDAPGAFLIPAWSVSLEWQFYLIAPFIYMLVMARPANRLLLAAICFVLFSTRTYLFPEVRYGAFLPFHIEFFFVGAGSYFLYKHLDETRRAQSHGDVWFPVAILLVAILISARTWSQIPLILWILFIGLILEPRHSYASRCLMPLFENKVTQYLGRISYSIYLSHILVIALVQFVLLSAMPGLDQLTHCMLLLLLSLPLTLALSDVLYRYIEVPGIAYGRRSGSLDKVKSW